MRTSTNNAYGNRWLSTRSDLGESFSSCGSETVIEGGLAGLRIRGPALELFSPGAAQGQRAKTAAIALLKKKPDCCSQGLLREAEH